MDNQKSTSYDRLAKHYDFLSRLVFFKSQVLAQTEHLNYLKDCKHLLIVGGGTGWILKNLNTLSKPIHITFVETSAKMIKLAMKVNTRHQVEFVHQDIESFNAAMQFDSVLTPFLFDNFDDIKAQKVFVKIDNMLLQNAFWLYTDFRLDGTWWKSLLLKSMHLFFSLMKVVKINTLPKMENSFITNGYDLKMYKYYYGSFIEAKVYRKQ